MGPRRDPRPYQIAVLTCLITWGALALDFEVRAAPAVAGLAGALGAQWIATRVRGLPRFDARSALVSGLSLALLLRTSEPALAALAGVLAVGSKSLVRVRGKHLFNPSCLAIVALLLTTDRAWVSSGQWGSAAWLALGVAGLGFLVVHRAARSEVPLAFLGFWSAILFGRALWLGDPIAIPLHDLGSGALLVFAFHMISDPKTLPDARAGRLVFTACVAAVAALLRFGLYEPDALLYALALCAPLTPLLDRWLPGSAYVWRPAGPPAAPEIRPGIPVSLPYLGTPHLKENSMSRPASAPHAVPAARVVLAALALALPLLASGPARAFCGFYVAKADAKLFNRASQVVLVRDEDRTVLTMSNDFQGEPREFAMVVPVPTFLEREQIHVTERAAIEHLDAYTAPRLVEYHDGNPCAARRFRQDESSRTALSPGTAVFEKEAAAALGVRVEAAYDVGEYDIRILSAEESDGLAVWLRQEGYRLPEGAEPVLESYLKQDMRFFVAKVDLAEHARRGATYLRPLQIAYESRRFMLPIRLGTLNARGPQELFVYALTRTGRVETTNYRTVKLPTGVEIPPFVKEDFGAFYEALFDEQVRREDMRTVFTEYAWDMAWCDPCAADPLSAEELRGLGVFWMDEGAARAPDVFVTRLHVRYDRDHFPDDLRLQETGDRANFQGRYVIRHAWKGEASCPEAEAYRRQLRSRRAQEARQLASLTGWALADLRERLDLPDGTSDGPPTEEPWWRHLWQD